MPKDEFGQWCFFNLASICIEISSLPRAAETVPQALTMAPEQATEDAVKEAVET